jgi:hypothetical protein
MLELLTAILGPLLFLPIMTGYYAYSHGRSFWRWFAIGCGLPFFSLIVVAVVVERNHRRQRHADHKVLEPKETNPFQQHE